MTKLIVNIAAERFGTVIPKPTPSTYTPSHRVKEIKRLRKELKLLKRQYKAAGEVERAGLEDLRGILRKQLVNLCRAEYHRKRRRERARKRAAFLANPFKLTKQLLGQKRTGKLTCSKEAINNHLKATYSDPYKEQPLGPCGALLTPPEPTSEFNMKEPCRSEVEEVVRRARSSSAPGPSGVPYKVYKNCPKLLHRLWKALKVIWRRGKIAQPWRYAEGVYIPKEEKSENIDQFRVISLLCVESKIFFSIVAKRLSNFLLSNKYIDTSMQKGGIPGVPGCLEHTGVVTQLIREAREGRGDLAVLWLDLTNAYGSIPHKLVEVALEKHHVPQKVKDIIIDYYSKFSLRVSSGQLTSDWHQLEVGKAFNCSFNDSDSIRETSTNMKGWLKAVDKSGLPGIFKAWVYQHGILLRLLWPLLIYEVPMTVVEGFELKVSCYLRRWLGLPRSLSNIGLYGNTNKLKLPFGSVREELIVARTREHLKVSRAETVVRKGRKWRAAEAVKQAATRLKHKAILGAVAQGSARLGSLAATRYDLASRRERQRLVQEEVCASVEEKRSSRAMAMPQQGAWMKGKQAMEWNVKEGHLDIQPPENQVLDPRGLRRSSQTLKPVHVGRVDTPTCPLCSKPGTHSLSSCSKALGEGQYRWRHGQVLKSIAEAISKGIKDSRLRQATAKVIHFIKEGQRPERTAKLFSAGLLSMTRDWVMSVDLERQLKIPPHVTQSTLRPDIILVSEATRQLTLLELTVPWEERMEEAQERKRGKYQELVEQCRMNGWRIRCMPVEVGSRGIASNTLSKAYGTLGITGTKRRKGSGESIQMALVEERWGQ
nr:reverse transcriptase [Danio rerio]